MVQSEKNSYHVNGRSYQPLRVLAAAVFGELHHPVNIMPL